MGKTLYVPIAFDLRRANDGSVELGAGTKKACDQAARNARDTNSEVFVSATHAGPEYDCVGMGALMKEYIESRYSMVKVRFRMAPSFNTMGEVIAVGQECKEFPDITGVVFCVKDWHAPRVKVLASCIFSRLGISIPFRVRTHRLKVPKRELLKERVKTFLTPLVVWRTVF